MMAASLRCSLFSEGTNELKQTAPGMKWRILQRFIRFRQSSLSRPDSFGQRGFTKALEIDPVWATIRHDSEFLTTARRQGADWA